MKERLLQTLSRTLVLSLFSMSLSLIASDDNRINTVNRIDSLTMKLMSVAEITQQGSINTFEQEITEEIFNEKMKTLGSSLDFKYTNQVAMQIRYMVNPASKFMAKTMPKSSVYLPIFEEILDKRKLPEEIKFLSVIESALSPNAVSWCGATGLWQFMPGTGKLMNLEINGQIDERKDIIKSTEKAFDYLQNMYDRYGDWFMAMAAYNCGPGNLNKAIRRSGGKTDFWSVQRFLPKETQMYIPKFIATVFVMNFVDLNSLFCYDEEYYKIVPIELSCPINLNLASSILQWDEHFIDEYNSFYKAGFIPEMYENKKLYLPYYAAMQFIEAEDLIYAVQEKSIFANNKSNTVAKSNYHKVKPGESLTVIASRYKTSVSEIKRMNNLKSDMIHPGQNLKITEYVKVEPKEIVIEDFAYYVVQNEPESISDICDNLGICDVDKIVAENECVSECDLLSRGTLIKIYPKSDLSNL